MSLNRENVVWKDRQGTWNIGFFDYYQTGEDHEWDVEYDYSTFNFCSTGHATEEDAHASWHGANPGGCETLHEPSAETDRYDAMAVEFKTKNIKRRF